MRYAQGIKFALLTAGFSGAAVFLNSLTVKAVGDALVFTTIKNLGVAMVMAAILWRQQINWQIVRSNWKSLAAIAVIGGSLPFYLFFKGLSLSNPAVGALIHKTLVFWVALWAVPVLKEKINVKQWLALAIIFGSNLVIGGLPAGRQGLLHLNWGAGETMILVATLLWSIENIIAKRVLRRVSVDVVVGARMILGSLILLVAAAAGGKLNLIFKLNSIQWLMTLVSVFLLSGYVMSWYRALTKAPITLVATVLSLATVITNVLSVIFITQKVSLGILYQMILLGIGTWIFAREAGKSGRSVALG